MRQIEIITLSLSFVGIFLGRIILYKDINGGFLFGILGMMLTAMVMYTFEDMKDKQHIRNQK